MSGPSALPADQELVERTGWLIKLRWVAVVGVACAIEISRRMFPVHLPLVSLYAVVLCLACYNFGLYPVVRRLRRTRVGGATGQVGARVRLPLLRAFSRLEGDVDARQAAVLANVQISLDLIALAALVHFSGGIENPFMYFSVFHAIIGSILLSRPATYIQATLGLILISAVAIGEGEGVLRHYPLGGLWRPTAFQDPLVVGGQLLVLGATLYLAVYFATSITAHLRSREREVVFLSREVAQKAEMLEAANARLTHTEQAKSQYMRKVSHELRGPFGTIQTVLKVAMEGLLGELPEHTRDLIQRAERRAGELAQVTQDLLALSRAKEGRLEAERSPVDLAALASDLVSEMASLAERAGVSVHLDAAPAISALQADPAGLRQLMGNLLSNAIRYTPQGGNVTVRLSQTGETVHLEVQDTGIGIPPEDLHRIFDEFYRSPNARTHTPAGTGLGLAIVKAVAEQHGGSVALESTVGQGTRFVVALPLQPAPYAEVEAITTRGAPIRS